MARKLNERERHILIGGVLIGLAIVVFNFGPGMARHWRQVRADLAVLESKLKDLPDAKQRTALLAVVPVLEIPQPEDKQKFLFLDRLREQLNKAGINNTEPLSFLGTRRKVGSYKTLCIKCKARCKLDQLLDLLVSLKENQYLMGVEELKIQCDMKQPPEKRQEVDVDLTVSTLVQDTVTKVTSKEPS
jgi:hypothetical protein